MINRRLSHRNNIPGFRALDKPLCTNVIDFSVDDSTDPSVPLPVNTSLTVNAPAKAGFNAFGIIAFTSSLNSLGITSSSYFTPFSVANPARVSLGLIFDRTAIANGSSVDITQVKAIRYSDSPATEFSVDVDRNSSEQGVKIAQVNGMYLRSDLKYLLKAYCKTVGSNLVYLTFVYSTVKFLPLRFSAKGTSFEAKAYYYPSAGGFRVLQNGETTYDFELLTSYEVIDLPAVNDSFTEDVPLPAYAIFYGSSSLVFDFNSV